MIALRILAMLRRASGGLAVASLLVTVFAGELRAQDRAEEVGGAILQNPEEVTARLDRILTDPKYRRLLPREEKTADPSERGWWDALLDWLAEFFERDPSPAPNVRIGFLPNLLDAILYLLVFVAVLLTVAFIVRALLLRSHESKGGLEEDDEESLANLSVPPGELPADVYVQKANELAAMGDYRGAVRQLLLGCMSWIERAGKIRYRKGLTNRDYLRAVWRQLEHRRALAAIVDVFDQVYFGRRPATRQWFDRCREQYQEGFGAEEKQTTPAA